MALPRHCETCSCHLLEHVNLAREQAVRAMSPLHVLCRGCGWPTGHPETLMREGLCPACQNNQKIVPPCNVMEHAISPRSDVHDDMHARCGYHPCGKLLVNGRGRRFCSRACNVSQRMLMKQVSRRSPVVVLVIMLLFLLGSDPREASADGTVFSPNCTEVSWQANTESDLGGYRLYHRASLSAPYAPYAVVPNTATNMLCSSLQFGAGQHYISLTAFDTSGNESGFSTEIAFVVQPTTANQVSDLTVIPLDSTSLTLQWTEVDNGLGSPANYDVRYAIPPIQWGSAASVASGTCMTPVTGVAIGAIKTCTITGLTAHTTYNVQLVPFRGTLNVDAIFQPLSNVAAGMTANDGTIFVDSSSVSAVVTNNSVSWTHPTTDTPTGRMLMIAPKNRHSAACSASSVTANGTALTKIRSDDGASGGDHFTSELWYLLSPPTGTLALSVIWSCTPSVWAIASAVILANVHQSSPIDAQHGATGTTAALANSITTVNPATSILDAVIGQADGGLTLGSNQTAIENGIAGSGDAVGMSIARRSTTGTEVMDWTQNGGAGQWASSAVALKPAPLPPPPDSTPPPQVTGLSLSQLSPTSLRLSHAAVTDNSGGSVTYYYERSTDGVNFEQIGNNLTLFMDMTGLTSNMTYYFRVKAQDPALNFGGYSAVISGLAFLDVSAPAPVTNLGGQALSQTDIRLTWLATTDNVGVTQYTLQRSAAGCSAFSTIFTGNALTYQDTGRSSGTTYCYRVRGEDLAGNLGTFSSTISVATLSAPPADTTPPTQVQSLTGSVLSDTQLSYTWAAATDANGIHHYNIYDCAAANCASKTLLAQPPLNSYTRTGLINGTTYYTAVSAVDPSGNEGTLSGTMTLTTLAPADVTPPSQLTGLAVLQAQYNSVTLVWDIGTDDMAIKSATIKKCIGVGCTNFTALSTTSLNVVTDSGVLPNQTIRYKGFFVDLSGNTGQESAIVTVTTPDVPVGTSLGQCPCRRRN